MVVIDVYASSNPMHLFPLCRAFTVFLRTFQGIVGLVAPLRQNHSHAVQGSVSSAALFGAVMLTEHCREKV